MSTESSQQSTTPAGDGAGGGAAAPTSPAASGGEGQQASGTTTPAEKAPEKPAASALGGKFESEKKADGEVKAEGEKKTDAAAELEIKLPDGVEVDAALLSEFKTVAKEAGLTSEGASKLAAWHVEKQAKDLEAWKQQGQKWEAENKAKYGAKYDETVAFARKGLLYAGGQELADDLARLGIDNHPLLLAAYEKVGRALGEDSSDTGGGVRPGAALSGSEIEKNFYAKPVRAQA